MSSTWVDLLAQKAAKASVPAGVKPWLDAGVAFAGNNKSSLEKMSCYAFTRAVAAACVADDYDWSQADDEAMLARLDRNSAAAQAAAKERKEFHDALKALPREVLFAVLPILLAL